ncbi:single-stranded-DNA-specific exonuclease RecJ [Paenibacillus sp. HB172176]|uniref:single-stranded-DNA-specific exonuclease RecJ n=1 Tax=Paenibacillus sp. HB172176 TaxID=2493690 RepID=UPI00143A082F|nr:single-stranded-DNA-specific exonuclease RecJ [Paenibacillus sp. HB172176]
MIEAKTRWAVAPWTDVQEQQAGQLSATMNLPPLVTKLLVQRGYTDEISAHPFLYGGEEQFHDPYLLHGMEAAVARIRQAKESGEKVRIYGDYDADGVSSTSLLILLFRELELDFDYYIPHRALEGYGLNRAAIALAAEQGVRLIVTVDTGISAFEEVEYAKELGMDMVITDHHEPPERIPAACAVVNPKLEQCAYPFKGLAGVGVAFKLASALLGRPPIEWTDIASMGTVADLMPLTDENRVLVKLGLDQIRTNARIGYRALAEVCGVELPTVQSTSIGFSMAPRINAAGRLDHAKRAVELLTAADYDDAIQEAIRLDSLNKERQRIVDEIVNEAEQQWADKCERAEAAGEKAPAVIVLAGEGWNVGVVGIVASKLLERHYRPVIIFGIDAETRKCKGSARSIEGFDLHAALTRHEGLLDHYGGHQAAAGMTLEEAKLDELEAGLSALALEWVSEEQWIPRTVIDLACGIEDAGLGTISQLSLLEPFGMGNPSPLLLFEDIELADRRAIGKDAKHLKLSLAKGRRMLDAIGFGMGEKAGAMHGGTRLDVVGELSVNEWNGQSKPQLRLLDLRSKAKSWNRFPSRDQFGAVYQQIRRNGQTPLSVLYDTIPSSLGLTKDEIRLMLDVFKELRFVEIRSGVVLAAQAPEKRELASSRHYQAAWAQYEQATSLA